MNKIRKLKQIRGGANCDVYVYTSNGVKRVIKITGNGAIDKEMGRLIIKDYLSIKNNVSKHGVRVPETQNIYLTADTHGDLVIIENYCGTSLDVILRNKRISSSHKVLLIKNCIKVIKLLPEKFSLDTRSDNFVIDKNGISFVDFIPPEPWKYKNNKKIQDKLKKIFPTLELPNYPNKKISYYRNKYRINRLLYHCKKICPEIEKFL